MPCSVDEVVEAFLRLYARDKLERWRELFLPAFIAVSTNADGTLTTYTLEQFYERQRALFATGQPVSETMTNTQKQVSGRLAAVSSDYVWTDGSARRPGRLMMLLVEESGCFRIQALSFSYAN